MKRLIGGFLIAPGIPLVVYLAVTSKLTDGTFVIGGLLIVYGLATVFGIPLFLLLRHLGWLRWWQISLMGAAAPLLLATDWLAHPPCCESTSFRAIEAGFFVLVGMTCGFLFWLIALCGNSAVTSSQTSVRNVA